MYTLSDTNYALLLALNRSYYIIHMTCVVYIENFIYMQKKKLSSLIFDHIYKFLEDKDKRFSSYGINGPETLFIQELIDHDLIDRLMVQPDRQFLYEVL